MSRWKLIALDMDGTLLDQGDRVSEENRRWIERAQASGIHVTLATGRMYHGIVPMFIRELDIRVPVVTGNGGEVWTADGVLMERHTLSTEDFCSLLALAREYRTYYWCADTEAYYHEQTLPDNYSSCTWIKFGFMSEQPDVLQSLWERLSATGRFELTNSDPANIEVNPKGVTKARGLQTVCHHLGIEAHEVIAMGDSLNDVSMIRWAGLGVAMGNAQPEVKRVADYVAASYADHGVAQVIASILEEGSGNQT